VELKSQILLNMKKKRKIIKVKIKCLDHGFVEFIDKMGNDYRILESARMSTGGVGKTTKEKDRGLIRYLYRNKHLTPFEQVTITLHMKMPIFVMRQLIRHRTQSVNEFSGRYSEMPQEFYTPDKFYQQSTKNHQGTGEVFEDQEQFGHLYRSPIASSYSSYFMMLDIGVAKEQSRLVLPLAQYTEFYTTMNLRNLFHLLSLRLHPHAQYEIRVYAKAILQILRSVGDLKWSIEIFEEINELEEIFQNLLNDYKDDFSLLKEKLNNL